MRRTSRLVTGMTRRGALALGVLGLTACAPARPKGRTTLIIGSGTGGGNDAFGQLFARHLQRLTGQTIQVEFETRAGGALAASRLAGAPADGSIIGMLPSKLIYEDQLATPEEASDLARLSLVGGIGADRRVLVVSARSAITSFGALINRAAPVILAASTLSSGAYVEALIVNHLTGAKLKPIPGYAGGARNLAVLSGEADGAVGDLASLQPLLDAGGRIILRLNDVVEPGSAQAPSLASVARGPDSAALLLLISAVASLGRMFTLPPEASPAVLDGWRSRLETVVADPDFRLAATAQGFNLDQTAGAQVEQVLHQLFDRSTPVIPALRRAMVASTS